MASVVTPIGADKVLSYDSLDKRRQAVNKEKSEFKSVLKKHGGFLWGVGGSMTKMERQHYKTRIDQLDLTDQGLTKAQKALGLGYLPYQPRLDWWTGWYWEQSAFRDLILKRPQANTIYRVEATDKWQRPLPVEPIKAFEKARSFQCFDVVLVTSPDRENMFSVDGYADVFIMLGLTVLSQKFNVWISTREDEIKGRTVTRPWLRFDDVALFKIFESPKVR